MRPEFVKTYPKPLSSDAFSKFASNQEDSKDNNEEVRQATQLLLNDTIYDFATKLDCMQVDRIEGQKLTEFVHRAGINVRYLARIRSQCRSIGVCSSLLDEMVSRTIKSMLKYVNLNQIKYQINRTDFESNQKQTCNA